MLQLVEILLQPDMSNGAGSKGIYQRQEENGKMRFLYDRQGGESLLIPQGINGYSCPSDLVTEGLKKGFSFVIELNTIRVYVCSLQAEGLRLDDILDNLSFRCKNLFLMQVFWMCLEYLRR